MFEGSLVESTTLLKARNRWPTVISVAIQAAIAATIIAVPLLHPEAIKLRAPMMTLIAPPPRPPQPPPPPPRPRVRMESASSSPMSAPTAPATNAPSGVTRTFIESTSPSNAPTANPLGLGMGTPSQPFSLDPGGSSSPHVVVATPKTGEVGPTHISSGVSSGMLLAPIRPDYPQIAKLSRTEGTVIIQAVISKTGHIESAHVVSGPAMLQAAALEAVRSAHYRPYLLNNQPTEVETTFSISFKISG
jgi:protein TonB